MIVENMRAGGSNVLRECDLRHDPSSGDVIEFTAPAQTM
jgi:hypothetical protein